MLKEARIVSIVSLFPSPQYVVVLEDVAKTRLIPIWIGVYEGNAIALELQGEKFPRPLTHDLIVNLLSAAGAAIEKIVISDLKNNSYYALIHLKLGGKSIAIDARPSDSLAIAVRIHCPIFIEEKVLLMCPPVEGPITQDEIDRFKVDLKSLSPEEFFKTLEEAPPLHEPGLAGGSDATEGDDLDDEDLDEDKNDDI